MRGREDARAASQRVQSTLHQAGLVINEAKSVWNPNYHCRLGFVVNLEQGYILEPVGKVDALKA